MADRPPAGFVQGVVVSPRIARVLEQTLDIPKLRRTIRGNDRELDETLNALRWAGIKWAISVGGRNPAEDTGIVEESEPKGITVGRAARRLGLTESRTRQLIRAGAIRAAKRDDRWEIREDDLLVFEATR